MAVWVYYEDVFNLLDIKNKLAKDELINIALEEAEKLGIAGSVCYLDLGEGAVVEIAPEEGASLKVIQADDAKKALFLFYARENECVFAKTS